MHRASIAAFILPGFLFLAACLGTQEALYKTSKWTLLELKGGSPVEGQFIEFMEDGTFAGYAGCNRIQGPFEKLSDKSSEGRLNIGPIIATKMACSELKAENLFKIALEETRFYRTESGNLVLLSSDKEKLAVLTPAVQ